MSELPIETLNDMGRKLSNVYQKIINDGYEHLSDEDLSTLMDIVVIGKQLLVAAIDCRDERDGTIGGMAAS